MRAFANAAPGSREAAFSFLLLSKIIERIVKRILSTVTNPANGGMPQIRSERKRAKVCGANGRGGLPSLHPLTILKKYRSLFFEASSSAVVSDRSETAASEEAWG
jgi:hypothetical protein